MGARERRDHELLRLHGIRGEAGLNEAAVRGVSVEHGLVERIHREHARVLEQIQRLVVESGGDSECLRGAGAGVVGLYVVIFPP